MAGVSSWLNVLASHIPKQGIANYCVSLYYNRSMVTLASVIIDTFKESAYYLGETAENLSFPDKMPIMGRRQAMEFGTIKGEKLVAFVSKQCPVSMVAAVSKARKMANEKQASPLIIAPLEKLSDRHLAMSRRIRNGQLLFVDDEKWRKNNLSQKIKLPLFIRVKDNVKKKTVRK